MRSTPYSIAFPVEPLTDNHSRAVADVYINVSNNIADRIGSPGIATGQAGGVYVRFGSTLTMNGSSTVRKTPKMWGR